MTALLRFLRHGVIGFAAVTAAVVLPPMIIHWFGGDVQAWKWPVIFYGGLASLLTGLFAVLYLATQAVLFVARKMHQAHG